MAVQLPRKRNLLADRCAIFEANKNSDSQSGSFLTNLVGRKPTTKNALKDDATQATMDISENSFSTIGSGSISASIRTGIIIETMEVIGEESISDNMFEHLRPPIDVTRKRSSLMSRMNVSDVSFDTVSPQVSFSNLFQNSFEFIHQPVIELIAKEQPFQQPKQRSTLITDRAATFEGSNSPPSGFTFSQHKSPVRTEKNDQSSWESLQQLQTSIASLKLCKENSADTKFVEKSEGSERMSPPKQSTPAIQSPIDSIANVGSENLDLPKQRAKGNEEIWSSLDTTAIQSFTATLEGEREMRSCETSPRIGGEKERNADNKTVSDSPRHTIHDCSLLIRKLGKCQPSPRIKTPEKRKAMLIKLLKNKRKPSVECSM